MAQPCDRYEGKANDAGVTAAEEAACTTENTDGEAYTCIWDAGGDGTCSNPFLRVDGGEYVESEKYQGCIPEDYDDLGGFLMYPTSASNVAHTNTGQLSWCTTGQISKTLEERGSCLETVSSVDEACAESRFYGTPGEGSCCTDARVLQPAGHVCAVHDDTAPCTTTSTCDGVHAECALPEQAADEGVCFPVSNPGGEPGDVGDSGAAGHAVAGFLFDLDDSSRDGLDASQFGECFEGHCRSTHTTQCHLFGQSEPCTIVGYECVAACMLSGVCTPIGKFEVVDGVDVLDPCRQAANAAGQGFAEPLDTCPVKPASSVCSKNGHQGTCSNIGACVFDNPCAEGGKCCTGVGGELLPEGTRWANCHADDALWCDGVSADPPSMSPATVYNGDDRAYTGSDQCAEGEHCNADGCCDTCADYQVLYYVALNCADAMKENNPIGQCTDAYQAAIDAEEDDTQKNSMISQRSNVMEQCPRTCGQCAEVPAECVAMALETTSSTTATATTTTTTTATTTTTTTTTSTTTSFMLTCGSHIPMTHCNEPYRYGFTDMELKHC